MALSDYRIFTLERQWAEELGIPPPPPKKRSLMKWLQKKARIVTLEN